MRMLTIIGARPRVIKAVVVSREFTALRPDVGEIQVHTVRGTSGHVRDIGEANALLQETVGFGNADYQGIEKRPDARAEIHWHIAMHPGKRHALDKNDETDPLIDQAEKLKAGVKVKLAHPFQVIKRQFGFMKVRYLGLKKNTAQPITLFTLSNVWMIRRKLIAAPA